MPDDLHEPWHIEGDGYWVSLVRADGYLVAQPIRRHEAEAILRWQRAYHNTPAVSRESVPVD